MVNALNDHWVPFENKIGVPRTTNTPPPDIRVSDFIDFGKGEWDCNALAQWFDADTVLAVLTIPLSSAWPQDKLFWWYTKNGEYLVKSGYWLGLLGNHNHNNAPTDDTLRLLWNRLWNIQAPRSYAI